MQAKRDVKCSGKHSTYQPSRDEWTCPECNAGIGTFCIDMSDPLSDDNCELMHDADELYCMGCQYCTTGKRFSALVVKRNSLVPCPDCSSCKTCGGKRFIKKGKI